MGLNFLILLLKKKLIVILVTIKIFAEYIVGVNLMKLRPLAN